MKKSASKQQKIKGGLITLQKTSQSKQRDRAASRQRQAEYRASVAVDNYARGFVDRLFGKEDYQDLVNHYADIFKTEGLDFKDLLEECNNIINRKNKKLHEYYIEDIKNQLVKCNKNGKGKVLLKTPTLSRDYILHKFNIEEREDRLYLVMKHESGEKKEIEIEPFTLLDFAKISSNEINSLKGFEINQKVLEAIENFLKSFDGKGTPEQKTQFLSNISSLLEELNQDASSDE
jgi:hypothetical protein